MSIIAETVTVYRSTERGRRFISKRAAIRAEAVAVIQRKYPTERFDPETGSEFHWTELDRSDVLLRRMMRLIASPPNQKGESE